MNTEMNGRQIKSIWWPDTEKDQGRHVTASEDIVLEFSATFHGDHDEFWVLEKHNLDGQLREVTRHNPRFLETIIWSYD